MILVHQVDPGWYDRYWYSDQLPDPVRHLPRRAFHRVMRWAWTIQAGPQVGEFKLWHSPLELGQARD